MDDRKLGDGYVYFRIRHCVSEQQDLLCQPVVIVPGACHKEESDNDLDCPNSQWSSSY